MLAREHTSYFYNEGAPSEGGPYHLATKTVDGAETASKEEFDKRTTETSYSGQEGFGGWKLRKSTSVTTDPGGVNLVHTTVYEPSTGEVKETTTPAATGEQMEEYALPKGSYPQEVTEGPEGNMWFTAFSTSKIGKITASGSSPPNMNSQKEAILWESLLALMEICGSLIIPGKSGRSRRPVRSLPNTRCRKEVSLWGSQTCTFERNLWFTEGETSKIGNIMMLGVLTEYELPKESYPLEIAAGPKILCGSPTAALARLGRLRHRVCVLNTNCRKGATR